MEVVMNMKKFIGLSLMCCLVAPNFVLLHSVAWGGCTVQQRIELGKQGYGKDEVEKTCTGEGEDFWEALSKGVVTDLANGLTNSLTKGLNHALVGRESNSTATASTPAGASVCVTNAGTCPLSGVPIGYPCYCRAWNGATFTGLSK
jgi:hypothetical protein